MLRRLAITAAIACLGSTAAAQPAMHLSTSGTGQVLIYPYYTTHGGLTTVLTVSNTTLVAKALRVRVLEGVASASALSFNLYLHPLATWSAALAPAGPGDAGAVLIAGSVGCTVPSLPPGQPTPLSVEAFTGANQDWDAATTSPARAALLGSPLRTRDGHIEIFEIGSIPLSSPFAAARRQSDCGRHREAWAPGGTWATDPARDITLPSGGLRGEGVLVDAAQGIVYGYAPVVIGGFHTDAAAPAALHTSPASTRPDLRDARSGDGVVRVELAATESRPSRIETFAEGLPRPDAVSALLIRSRLHGEAILDPALGADTEWVVTMPTRRWYSANPAAGAPFRFVRTHDGAQCLDLYYTLMDRAFTQQQPVPRIFVGSNGLRFYPTLCSSVSVASARRVAAGGGTRLLGARLELTGIELGRGCCFLGPPTPPIPIPDYEQFQTSGVVWIPLSGSGVPWPLPSGRRASGLPAIGLAITRYINANAQPDVLANYGMALPMASETQELPPAP